jgi:hypothetical protein
MKRYLNTKYLVSVNGEIINEKTNKKLIPQDNGKGYMKVTLSIEGRQIQRYVHRIVAECYLLNKSIQVNHKDGDKLNNNVSNLEWVTNSENQIHAHQTGLKKNGNELWNGKFSKEEIIKIKELKKNGIPQYKIAEIMRVSKSTISEILTGKRYKYFALTNEELTLKQN